MMGSKDNWTKTSSIRLIWITQILVGNFLKSENFRFSDFSFLVGFTDRYFNHWTVLPFSIWRFNRSTLLYSLLFEFDLVFCMCWLYVILMSSVRLRGLSLVLGFNKCSCIREVGWILFQSVILAICKVFKFLLWKPTESKQTTCYYDSLIRRRFFVT